MSENQPGLYSDLITAFADDGLLGEIEAAIQDNQDHDGKLLRLYNQLIKEKDFERRKTLLKEIEALVKAKYEELEKQEMQYRDQVAAHLDQLNRLLILLIFLSAQQNQEKCDYNMAILPPKPSTPSF